MQPACGSTAPPPTPQQPHSLPGFGNSDDSGPLFCLQHSSALGGVFGDSYYEQQMAARQANALSHQVSRHPPQTLARPRPLLCVSCSASPVSGLQRPRPWRGWLGLASAGVCTLPAERGRQRRGEEG